MIPGAAAEKKSPIGDLSNTRLIEWRKRVPRRSPAVLDAGQAAASVTAIRLSRTKNRPRDICPRNEGRAEGGSMIGSWAKEECRA